MGSSSKPAVPAAPDFGKLYQEGIDIYLKNRPALQDAEQQSRSTIDPQRIQAQQALQDQFGAKQTQQELDVLHQFDPESAAIRSRLGQSVLSDLNSGYNLPDDYSRELTSQIRGAQTARGNSLGESAAGAEAAFKGKAALDLYQEHLANAGAFLSGPTPEQQSIALQAVQPDRSMAYTNSGAGSQGVNFGLANYQNQLAQYQLAGQGGGNAWQRALHGAQQGGQVAGIWGAVGGAVDGAINGPVYSSLNDPNGSIGGAFKGGAWNSGNNYQWSDSRLKNVLQKVTTSLSGLGMYLFTYKSDPKQLKCIGALAHEVEKVKPEAVSRDSSGYLTVDYEKIDVPFVQLKGFA